MSASGRRNRVHSSRRGFVMVTMILSLVILMAFLGLAIDVGYEQYVKVRMQTAADAAALGGALELHASGSSNLVSSAKADAAANGFTDGQNSVTIKVNNPPATGYSIGDNSAVEVTLSQTVPAFFMEVLGFYSGTVKARAVARIGTGGTTCFYTLDPNMSNALSVTNGVSVSSACGIMVNSTSSTALTASGGADLSAPSIAVAGKYTISNGASISPAPTQGVPPVSNPLATLPPPAMGACTYTNYSVPYGTVTLNPGTYCNGLSIGGSATVTMNSGTYACQSRE